MDIDDPKAVKALAMAETSADLALAEHAQAMFPKEVQAAKRTHQRIGPILNKGVAIMGKGGGFGTMKPLEIF